MSNNLDFSPLLDGSGDARDLGQPDLSKLRADLKANLFNFAVFIFGFRDLDPDLHGEICALAMRWGQPGYKRLMVQIPRGHFKTSIAQAIALWHITYHPDEPIALFNAVEDNAKKWLSALRKVIQESYLYEALYPDLLPPGVGPSDTRNLSRFTKWSDSAIDLEGKPIGEKEYSISAHGVGGAATGGHWPKLILDDLIGRKEAESPAEMERARSWVRTHPQLMKPVASGMAWVNCTPWGYGDIYTDLTSEYGYKLYRRAALELPDRTPSIAGDALCPRIQDRESLLSEYRIDSFTFRGQKMCTPMAGRELEFDQAWLRYFSLTLDPFGRINATIEDSSFDPRIKLQDPGFEPQQRIPLSDMQKAIFLDPAPSEAGERRQDPNARNGIVVQGICPWGRRFLLEAFGALVNPDEVIQLLFSLATKWGLDRVYIEEVNFSKLYRYWINDAQRPGGRYAGQNLQAIGVPTGKSDKHTRIRSKTPGWRQGLYYLNRRGCDAFEEEFREYPYGRTLDLLDACGYDHYLKGGLTPYEAELAADQYYDMDYTRDSLTGY